MYYTPQTSVASANMGRFSSDTQQNINAAYKLAGLEAPQIELSQFKGGLQAEGLESIAATLTLGAVEHADDPASVDALVQEAVDASMKILAVKALNLEMEKTLPQHYVNRTNTVIRPQAAKELEPAITKTLSDITDAVAALPIPDPLNVQAIVENELDPAEYKRLAGALKGISVYAAVWDVVARSAEYFGVFTELSNLARFIDIPTPETPLWVDSSDMPKRGLDSTVDAVFDLQQLFIKTNNNSTTGAAPLIDIDHMLIRIARGEVPGLSLDYTTDEAEVARRCAAVTQCVVPQRKDKRDGSGIITLR